MSSNEDLKHEALEFVLFLVTQVARSTFVDAFWRRNEFESNESLGLVDKLGNAADCVTVADMRLEKLLFGALGRRFPEHLLVGEETHSLLDEGTYEYDQSRPTWIVDPIDGTNNFVHHFPQTSISVALAIDNSPAVGVVYMPVMDTLYFGSIGHGSYRLENASAQISSIYPADYLQAQDRPSGFIYLDAAKASSQCQKLPLISADKLGHIPGLGACAVLTEHGSDRSPQVVGKRTATISRLLSGPMSVQNLRILGAATIDIVNVACGSADMYFEIGPHVWDFAAAVVVLIEAGGAAFDGAGTYSPASCAQPSPPPAAAAAFDMWNRSICAVRAIPDMPGLPGSGRKKQAELAANLLSMVDHIQYTPDGIPKKDLGIDK
ncbi:Inositol monophosphatase 3 [Smittium culicis]|uniref:Inositol monophosphatase 3 n=1 Tax=Smittium culicis TaxID=133412 RepID=A0A1R1XLB5_9FUNG|nr:Inositol monophosphatase 3 [Smittium culicis]OMJ08849.1 Inositol monophosphatase 3 [Smittium culicis]OMJ15416.1 Inositol monophosphatase 3 [Smittium culicis]